MSKHIRFILTDDVAVNNLLTRVIIRKTIPGAEILEFTSAIDTLEYIQKNYPHPANITTILFLDIYMPQMSGWDFLKQYETLDKTTRTQISVYMLSSSISAEDQARARENKEVVSYLQKPTSEQAIAEIATSI